MEFRKFGTIDGATNSTVARFAANAAGDPCVATEKAHGMNFSVQMSLADHAVAYGRRTAFLEPDEQLVRPGSPAWQTLMCDMYPAFERAASAVREAFPGAATAVFYGELIGPGVFTQVDYGPGLDFYGFDICVDDAYLPFDEMCRVYDEAGILRSIVIARGPLEQLVHLDPESQSRIAARRGHAAREVNTAEGVVIVPDRPRAAFNGKRCILKIKSSGFGERAKVRTFTPPPELTEESATVLATLLEYVTPARVRNAQSKSGVGAPPGRLCFDVLQDVLADSDVKLKPIKQRRQITAAVLQAVRDELAGMVVALE
jgi:Rnl2 family RNA ligase